MPFGVSIDADWPLPDGVTALGDLTQDAIDRALLLTQGLKLALNPSRGVVQTSPPIIMEATGSADRFYSDLTNHPTYTAADPRFNGLPSLRATQDTTRYRLQFLTGVSPTSLAGDFTLILAVDWDGSAGGGGADVLWQIGQTNAAALFFAAGLLTFRAKSGDAQADWNAAALSTGTAARKFVVGASYQASTKKSEVWIDGALNNAKTHTGGTNMVDASLLIGAAGGTSRIHGGWGGMAYSSLPLAARDGSGNLVYPGVLQSVMLGIKQAYGW